MRKVNEKRLFVYRLYDTNASVNKNIVVWLLTSLFHKELVSQCKASANRLLAVAQISGKNLYFKTLKFKQLQLSTVQWRQPSVPTLYGEDRQWKGNHKPQASLLNFAVVGNTMLVYAGFSKHVNRWTWNPGSAILELYKARTVFRTPIVADNVRFQSLPWFLTAKHHFSILKFRGGWICFLNFKIRRNWFRSMCSMSCAFGARKSGPIPVLHRVLFLWSNLLITKAFRKRRKSTFWVLTLSKSPMACY